MISDGRARPPSKGDTRRHESSNGHGGACRACRDCGGRLMKIGTCVVLWLVFWFLPPTRLIVASDGKPSKKELATLSRVSSSLQYLVQHVDDAFVLTLAT